MKSNRCNRETICLLASGALAEQEKVEAENHLAACACCREYYDEVKSLAAPLANWERNFARIEPSQTLQTRWANAIKNSGESKSANPLSLAVRAVWCELIWPCRHAWTGMTALWLVMWGINSGLNGGENNRLMAHSTPIPAMLQAMEEQRQLLAELIPPSNRQPAEPPRRNQPQPRSEMQTVWAIG